MGTKQTYDPTAGQPTATDSTVGQPTQTANNSTGHRLSTAEWQNRFLQRLLDNQRDQEYFFRVLDMVRDFYDKSEPTVFIANLFEQWVENKGNDLNPARHNIRDLVNHIVFLQELRTYYACFDNDTDYTSESEENGRKYE